MIRSMTASERITNYINELDDWRGEILASLRKLLREVSPDLIEEWKWNTPVWSRNGNVVAIGAFQDHIKVNFFKGASLDDSHRLFNGGLDAKASRAIDIHEGQRINGAALKDLVRAAVALNTGESKSWKPRSRAKES
jgi:hypothetical protein